MKQDANMILLGVLCVSVGLAKIGKIVGVHEYKLKILKL